MEPDTWIPGPSHHPTPPRRALFNALFTFPEEYKHMLKERASGMYRRGSGRAGPGVSFHEMPCLERLSLHCMAHGFLPSSACMPRLLLLTTVLLAPHASRPSLPPCTSQAVGLLLRPHAQRPAHELCAAHGEGGGEHL